jgi:hypothetical protein
MARARALALVCLFLLCSAVFGEEDFDRMLELYRQSGYADLEQRLREYEALQEMRRANGDRHLPAGTQFDFARESFRLRSHKTGDKDANGCAWTSVGPTNVNGRVIAIAIDPQNNQILYAATVGGLWRSTTAGRKWQRVSDDFVAMRYSSVAVNPVKHQEVLAGAGDRNMTLADTGNGLYQSLNFGAPGSWTHVTSPFDGTTIYRIRIDPKPPHDVYVAATNGVWVGKHDPNTDALTFTAPLGGFDGVTHDLVVDFNSTPRIVYAGVRYKKGAKPVGIYKWDGVTWQKKDDGIDTSDAHTIALALSEWNPSILYAKVSQLSDETLIGIFKTTTAAEKPVGDGHAWEPLPFGDDPGEYPDDSRMGWFNTMIEVDPTNPDRVFVGGLHIWMSTKGGTEWKDVIKGTDPSYPLESHGDVHTLAFDPVNPNIVYVGNDGGIDRSTDTSQPVWHWNDVAHGMNITMYYYLTSNRVFPTLLAGGTQDNGTQLTFGNRTWYMPRKCDGYDVGSDAANPSTLYANCNHNLLELANPVPGTNQFPAKVDWIAAEPPRPVLITDEVVPGAALAGGGWPCEIKTIVKTADGVKWTPTAANFKAGAETIALASAPNGAFDTFLAAVAYKKPDEKDCPDFVDAPFNPYVIRSDTGGDTWTPMTGLPANLAASSVAFDPKEPNRSYVTYSKGSGKVFMSTTAAGPYFSIAGSGGTALPAGARNIVVDPNDTNVLYVATSVGMFRGVVTLGAMPTAAWAPFDEGLPDAMEINDLWVDPVNGILTIGSFGYGAFRRDIRQNPNCATRMLVVRDCVNDDGREDSPCGGPDMEHPIQDPTKNGFFKPDDTLAGKAYWWTSRDIRVDVPANAPAKNQIGDADSVEFDSCPSTVFDCPPQTMIDASPEKLKDARVYVQVTNRGTEPVTNTRVIALWYPSSSAFEKLPANFWTATFPLGGPCGPLDPSTGWKLIDPATPCRMIASVTPEMPELARFNWKPPSNIGFATLLTIVESELDPLDPSIRQQNKLSPAEIVPGSRHIALRSLQINPFEIGRVPVPFLWPLDLLHLPNEMTEVEVVVSKPDLHDGVRIVLPAGLTAKAGMGSVRQTRVTETELVRQLESMHLDPNNAWEFTGDEASLFVDLRPGQRVTTGVIATPADTRATSQVSIVERSRGKVVGGSVMLLRPKM